MRDFFADNVADAIADGKPLQHSPLYAMRVERDGKELVGIASDPNFWLHIADALSIAGHTDVPNAAIYRACCAAICAHFEIVKTE